jgi:hypothetical protein
MLQDLAGGAGVRTERSGSHPAADGIDFDIRSSGLPEGLGLVDGDEPGGGDGGGGEDDRIYFG